MGSHTYFLFTILCMFTFGLAKSDEINAVLFNQTGLNPVIRKSSPRVLGGVAAPESTYRTLANILIVGKKTGSEDIGNLCTATVLNRRWLLTAAHCFFFPRRFEASVQGSYAYIGELDATLTPDTSNIRPYFFSKFLIHREYIRNRIEFGNDIALIFLDRPIARTIFRSVQLSPTKRSDPSPVGTVQVAGYGFVDNPLTPETKVEADRAMQASVTHQTFEECSSRVGTRLSVLLDETSQVCSVPRPNGRGEDADICFGDSGGPIFTVANGRVVQFGITSFANTFFCATSSTVSYYTRVSSFRRDIRQGRRMNFASWNVVDT